MGCLAARVVTSDFGRWFFPFLIALFCLPALASEQLAFDAVYKSNGVLGLKFAERTLALKGQTIRMRGFMAPPLKPESKFFVLSRQPIALCPFCSSDAEWPVDIVVVYLKSTVSPTGFSDKIEVEGRLELGSWTDPQTGFVSQMRLVDATLKKL